MMSDALTSGGKIHLAMPARRRGQKLSYSFDEDDLTLAWDAVQAARLPAGTKVAAGFAVPAWFWAGCGLVAADDAPWRLESVPTTVGPSVVLRPSGDRSDVEADARHLYLTRKERPEPEWQKHRVAREGPDTEADFPLGAFVLQGRHDEVTAQRMRLAAGKVVSFTAIGPGAAPTEFTRLQDAVGAYHVVLVEGAAGKTVGLWSGDAPPALGQAVRPVLRRLFRTQGAWRHGVKFLPA